MYFVLGDVLRAAFKELRGRGGEAELKPITGGHGGECWLKPVKKDSERFPRADDKDAAPTGWTEAFQVGRTVVNGGHEYSGANYVYLFPTPLQAPF